MGGKCINKNYETRREIRRLELKINKRYLSKKLVCKIRHEKNKTFMKRSVN
jgi:hypothetical protein